jgi:hypothetical protein
MKAVHSYKFDKARPMLESFGGPAIVKPLITIMALSAATIRRHHDDFVLITDDIGAKLARACNMPYSEIVSVGHEFGSHDCFWIHSKLYAYATMDCPFVHYDTDILLWDPLPQEFLSSDLFNFHSEAFAWPIYEQRLERLSSAGIKLPSYEERYPANKSPINMAIFGGHDVDTINSYGAELLDLMEDNDRFYGKSDAAVSAMEGGISYIEQALGSYIIQSKHGKKVTPLLKEHQVVSGQAVPGIKITHMHSLKQAAQAQGKIIELQAKLDKKLKEVAPDVHSAVAEFTKPEVDIAALIQEANSNDSNLASQEA